MVKEVSKQNAWLPKLGSAHDQASPLSMFGCLWPHPPIFDNALYADDGV